MNWTTETLNRINQADDLYIAPFRANGIAGTPTWIWEVVVDNRLFVRAYNGKKSSWYQSAMANKEGIIQAAGQEFNVTFQSINDAPLLSKIDDAYQATYAPSPYVAPMIAEQPRQATVEIQPKDNK
ncbi:DUF2255 family protein [Fructobacillus parabroussonetiae]|uniref:DUF2255 family protein n=1 Tax=Fructobacillus parabroussonetiae TaxID=2713174 RepID=A0ABS5QXG2_9LACO|nr:DUF2255 family protein [Fructobacillus parabroussonetiae]MBS9337280.1 DUF2255 family protein [Fructobacillus parabroussonetiae]